MPEDSSDDEDLLDAGRAERNAHYPETGFALVEIDMLRLPGEALTGLGTFETLADARLPEATELVDYVIYDADGHAYTHETLREMRERVAGGENQGLLEDLRTEDRHAKRLALYGLSVLAEDSPADCLEAIPILETGLNADETDIRVASLEILATLSESHPDQVTPVVDEVIPLIEVDASDGMLEHGVTLLNHVAARNPQATLEAPPKLTSLLQADVPDEAPVMTALKRIAEVYPDAVVPAVEQLMDYIDEGSSAEKVSALGLVGTVSKEYPQVARSSIPAVTDLLESDSYALRANAAGLLADLADDYPEDLRSTVPIVIGLLDDEDEKARYNATSILARLAKAYPDDLEPAIDPLMGVLDDEFPFTRGNACWALGRLEAKEALAELEALAENDPHEEVRAGADFAVSQIRGGS